MEVLAAASLETSNLRVLRFALASLLMLMVPALIGGLSITHPLHWVFAAIDQAFAMLFFASVVGLAVWSRLVDMEADGRRKRA